MTIVAQAWQAELRGWGPDFAEVCVGCPREGCHWVCEWDSDQLSVSLVSIADAVSQHLVRDHGILI
jgi:hypothetical protein